MKIAVIGAQKTGKSTFVNRFLQSWPMYEKPQKTYRDVIREKGLSTNRSGDKASQIQIMDALIEQIQQDNKKPHVIHDRCVLDCLAYSMYLHEQPGTDIDDAFIQQQVQISSEVVKMYDVLLYCPADGFVPVGQGDANNLRDNDDDYRTSIDNIFQTFHYYNQKRNGILFQVSDAPPIVPLGGSVEEKIMLTRLYVTEQGDSYETGIKLDEELDKMPRIIS